MLKWLVAFGILGAMWFTMFRSLNPSVDVKTFVETPEIIDAAYSKDGAIVKDSRRVMKRVDPAAPEIVIKWPTWKSKEVIAPPIELRIRRDQLAAIRDPIIDRGFLAPDSVTLKLNWPESEESRAGASAEEEAPRVVLSRGHGEPGSVDLLTREQMRDSQFTKFATPVDAPRDQGVIVTCVHGAKGNCSILFEHQGRTTYVYFPGRRADDWEQAREGAQRLLASITSPL
jgi:hypothetical protein